MLINQFITIKIESQQERRTIYKDEVSELFNMFDKEDIGVRDTLLFCIFRFENLSYEIKIKI